MPRSPNPRVALVAVRYELVRELRVDRQTIDWEAFDTALERQVIVQLLRPELAQDADATEQFWQVARAAAHRTAPVGERVLDAGTDPETGRHFIVREWPAALAAAAEGPRLLPPEPAVVSQLRSRFDGRPRWLVPSGVALVLILVVAAIKPGVEGWLAWVNTPFAGASRSFGLAPAVAVPANGAQPGQSTSTPAPAPPTVVAAARSAPAAPTLAASSPTRATTSTPGATGQTRRIVNTDGQGVALRATAGGDRLPGKGYDEGASVQALEQSGEWTRIRGSDGREGWVLSVTLAP
jgi:hypothetical protein